jgi:arylsulfatase A-like enzyme
LGRILGAVEAQGQAAHTVTVFCADHGEFLGDYSLVEKWPSGLDLPLTRVPLLIHDPRRVGGVVRSPVELHDVFATLCELAGVEPAHTHFAKSLLPLMDDPSAGGRPFAVTEGGFRVTDVRLLEEPVPGPYFKKAMLQREHPELVATAVALRTPEWTYVRRSEEGHELYDRLGDSDEIHNCIRDPALSNVVRQLESRLTDWLMHTSDVIPWERDPRFPKVPDGYRH